MSMQNLDLPTSVEPIDDPKEERDLMLLQVPVPVNIVTPPIRKREFYGSLSEIQAELEDLQSILATIRKGQAIIPVYAEYIETTKTNLRELITFVNTTALPAEVENNLHTLRHLNNAWEQMQVSPLLESPNANYDIQQQLHYLDLLDEQIHTFNYQISLLTIPHQINEWLRITGPGYYIPFHEVFANELPSSADRDRLLKYIALTPHLTSGGFVDVESGRIYRYSTNKWRRMFSIAMVFVGLGIATGIVAAACYLRVPDWPLTAY